MAADERPIIIKRIKKVGGGHHGGAWKVAYADFVTAMMAFFLLLWLLNAVTEEQKQGIANYFRPTIAPSNPASSETILNGQPAVMTEVNGSSAAQATVQVDTPAEDATADPSAATPDAKPGDQTDSKPVDVTEAQKVVQQAEQKQFQDVKSQIEQQIKQDAGLADLKDNIQIEQTPEGLRIQLLDREKVSMFPSGSAAMNEKSKKLLELVAKVVQPLHNKLSISGHTDATPLQGANGYTNWELSSDRANAARRELVQSGVDISRVENVSGKADTDPFIKTDPNSPQNRRISIVLLRDAPAVGSPAAAPAAAPSPALAPELPPQEIVPSPGSGTIQ
jgi:chemotaxis protein MotB